MFAVLKRKGEAVERRTNPHCHFLDIDFGSALCIAGFETDTPVWGLDPSELSLLGMLLKAPEDDGPQEEACPGHSPR